MSHPFGELLAEYRTRKRGLSQLRLANLVGYNHAVLARMSHGKKDLFGPSGRDRVVRILAALLDEDVSLTLAEANKLLATAEQPPLYEGLPIERELMHRLDNTELPSHAYSLLMYILSRRRHSLPSSAASASWRRSTNC